MINISGVLTPGVRLGIKIDAIDLTVISPDSYEFFRRLKENKQVLYDWGYGIYYTLDVLFIAKYEDGGTRILEAKSQNHVSVERFVGCCGETTFYNALRPYGNPGFTPADQILGLLVSGVAVELCDCEKYGPTDPLAFLADLNSVKTGLSDLSVTERYLRLD